MRGPGSLLDSAKSPFSTAHPPQAMRTVCRPQEPEPYCRPAFTPRAKAQPQGHPPRVPHALLATPKQDLGGGRHQDHTNAPRRNSQQPNIESCTHPHCQPRPEHTRPPLGHKLPPPCHPPDSPPSAPQPRDLYLRVFPAPPYSLPMEFRIKPRVLTSAAGQPQPRSVPGHWPPGHTDWALAPSGTSSLLPLSLHSSGLGPQPRQLLTAPHLQLQCRLFTEPLLTPY